MRYSLVTWILIATSVVQGFGQLTKLWELNLPTYLPVQPSHSVNATPYLKYLDSEDGKKVVVGRYTGDNRNQIYIFKHDPTGQVVWEYIYSSPYNIAEEIEDVCLDSYGNIIIVGSTITAILQTNNQLVGLRNWLILKISQSGELLMTREGSEQDSTINLCKSVFPGKNGNIYTAHLIEIDSIFYSYIYKFDSNGDQVWSRQVDNNAPLIVYVTDELIVFITEGMASHLYHFTENGNLIHTQDFGYLGYEKPCVDNLGNWYQRSSTGKYKS